MHKPNQKIRRCQNDKMFVRLMFVIELFKLISNLIHPNRIIIFENNVEISYID